MNATLWGIVLAAVAGLGAGSCLWPIKVIRRLRFEHYWFVGMLPLVLVPWLIVLTTIPDPWTAYAEVGWRPLAISNLFAIGWGIANVLAGLCVVRIGLALTGAILTGLGVTVAVTVPMVFKGTGLFSESPDLASVPGLAVVSSVAVMLLGVVLCSLAGFGRERAIRSKGEVDRPASGGFLGGLIMATLAGILSAGPYLSFVYGHGPIVDAMESHGVGDIPAGFSVWAAGLFGGALVNILYPAWLMTKNRSWGVLLESWGELFLGVLIGTQLILSFALQGFGMVMLGALGASVGTGIQQAMQIMGAQGVGFISGEWWGIGGRPRRQMIAAIVLLMIAVAIMVYAKTLS